jgi:hypothetical protein
MTTNWKQNYEYGIYGLILIEFCLILINCISNLDAIYESQSLTISKVNRLQMSAFLCVSQNGT